MATPGSNLLDDALTLICPDSFQYYRFMDIQTNGIGLDVRRYAPPTSVRGSVQAVDRSLYADAGLDFSKRYLQIWTSTDVSDLYRARAGDQVQWEGSRWEVTSENDWHPMDGWNSFLAVQVPTP